MKNPNHAPSLADLDIRTLPSVDLLGPAGWWGVKRLPKKPGCYMVIATLKPRAFDRTHSPERLEVAQGQALRVIGKEWKRVQQAIGEGLWVQLVLYIGYSKSIEQRWNKDWDNDGKPDHHKFIDLNATGYLLNTLFDLVDLRMHFLCADSAESAKAIEGYLIKLWRPLLNGRAPLFSPA